MLQQLKPQDKSRFEGHLDYQVNKNFGRKQNFENQLQNVNHNEMIDKYQQNNSKNKKDKQNVNNINLSQLISQSNINKFLYDHSSMITISVPKTNSSGRLAENTKGKTLNQQKQGQKLAGSISAALNAENNLINSIGTGKMREIRQQEILAKIDECLKDIVNIDEEQDDEEEEEKEECKVNNYEKLEKQNSSGEQTALLKLKKGIKQCVSIFSRQSVETNIFCQKIAQMKEQLQLQGVDIDLSQQNSSQGQQSSFESQNSPERRTKTQSCYQQQHQNQMEQSLFGQQNSPQRQKYRDEVDTSEKRLATDPEIHRSIIKQKNLRLRVNQRSGSQNNKNKQDTDNVIRVKKSVSFHIPSEKQKLAVKVLLENSQKSLLNNSLNTEKVIQPDAINMSDSLEKSNKSSIVQSELNDNDQFFAINCGKQSQFYPKIKGIDDKNMLFNFDTIVTPQKNEGENGMGSSKGSNYSKFSFLNSPKLLLQANDQNKQSTNRALYAKGNHYSFSDIEKQQNLTSKNDEEYSIDITNNRSNIGLISNENKQVSCKNAQMFFNNGDDNSKILFSQHFQNQQIYIEESD